MPLSESNRWKCSRWIAEQEVRLDPNGNPTTYKLPANDGGSTSWSNEEAFGLNPKYNSDALSQILPLLKSEQYEKAWRVATEEIAKDTDQINSWGISFPDAVEVFLRDCIFNRGNNGAKKIFQTALGVVSDGIIGDKTKSSFKSCHLPDFLQALRLARECYEIKVAGYRSNLYAGLTNRWSKCLTYSKTYLE